VVAQKTSHGKPLNLANAFPTSATTSWLNEGRDKSYEQEKGPFTAGSGDIFKAPKECRLSNC
jgi:hypothetical protein